jgi:hypothetical protein
MPDDFNLALNALCQVPTLLASSKWWIIGSMAARMLGLKDDAVNDIDVLMDVPTARACLAHFNCPEIPPALHPHFISKIHARIPTAGLTLDIMAGLDIFENGWHPVLLQTRKIHHGDYGAVYTPDAQELISVYLKFGRPKDLARAQKLTALIKNQRR